LVLTLCAIGSGGAQAAPAVALIAPKAISASFEDGAAPVTLFVRNSTSAPRRLSLKYVGAGAPTGLTIGEESPQGLSLVLVGDAVVPARDVDAVMFELRRRAKEPGVEGVIVLSVVSPPAPSTPPISVPISEAAAAKAAIGFEQKEASITTTALLGPVARTCKWLAGSDKCPGQHFRSRSTVVAARGVSTRRTIIGSTSGRNATVALTPRSRSSSTRARLIALVIPGPGSYSGAVAIDPAVPEPKSIALTVHAQDALYWALIALLLGAAVGALLTKIYDAWRSGNSLRISLQEGIDPYLRLSPSEDERRPDLDYLDDLLVLTKGGAPAGPDRQFPSRWSRRKTPEKAVPALYRSTYGLKTADVRASQAKQVETMVARFARWKRLHDAFTLLEKNLQALDSSLRVRRDGETVLDLAQGEPIDDTETQSREGAIKAFAQIAALYAEANQRWKKAVEELDPGWSDDHQKLDPPKIYAAEAKQRTPEQIATLRLALMRAQRLLADPENAPSDRQEAERTRLRLQAAIDEVVDADDVAYAEFIGDSGFAGSLIAPFVLRFQSAESIRRSVRDWDWTVFALVSVLSGLSYVLLAYVGKDWGSFTDYLTAFTAGAVVPTAINWALLPLSRGTEPTKTSEAAK
jgi:hypothetical protein